MRNLQWRVPLRSPGIVSRSTVNNKTKTTRIHIHLTVNSVNRDLKQAPTTPKMDMIASPPPLPMNNPPIIFPFTSEKTTSVMLSSITCHIPTPIADNPTSCIYEHAVIIASYIDSV